MGILQPGLKYIVIANATITHINTMAMLSQTPALNGNMYVVGGITELGVAYARDISIFANGAKYLRALRR